MSSFPRLSPAANLVAASLLLALVLALVGATPALAQTQDQATGAAAVQAPPEQTSTSGGAASEGAPDQPPPTTGPEEQPPPTAAPEEQPTTAAPEEQPATAAPEEQPPPAAPEDQPTIAAPEEQPPEVPPEEQSPDVPPDQQPQATPAPVPTPEPAATNTPNQTATPTPLPTSATPAGTAAPAAGPGGAAGGSPGAPGGSPGGGAGSGPPPATCPPAPPVCLSFSPSPSGSSVGTSFDVQIVLDTGAQPVDGVQLRVTFDPTKLQAVDTGAAPGCQITPGSQFTNPPDQFENACDNASGRIRFTVGQLAPPFPTGTFAVATVTFRALQSTAPGGTPLNFVTTATRSADNTKVTFGGVLDLATTSAAAVIS